MEARRRQGLRGQPAIELEIDPEGAFAIGANIDRDHLTIVAVDAVGNVRGRIHHEARFLLPDDFVKLMEDAVSSFLRRKVIRESRLAGIGLAIPDWLGEVQVIGLPDTYSHWNGFDVRAALSHITDHPIYIDNDANAAALGEIEYGLGTEMRSFFYILISACLGGSLVIDGVRHKGAGGLGGEIGWLPTAVTTGPFAGETRPLGDMLSMFVLLGYLADNGVDVSTPADLLTLNGRGRALLSGWLKKMAVNLAEAVSDIGMVVDPDGIILGGRSPVRLIDELLLYVHAEISRRGALAPSLHRAAASEDAAALGAAAMALADRLCLPSADPAHLSRSPLTTAIRPASINSALAAAVR